MTSINTNLSSLMAQNNLGSTQKAINDSIERLSTGKRINGAKDDSVGLTQANRMTAQISGNSIAQRNINDGISLSQTAESDLSSINDHLLEIRDLAQRATTDTMKEGDRTMIQDEINTRLTEIDRISSESSFNGIDLMDGSKASLTLQTGANTGETYDINLAEVTTATMIVDDTDTAVDLTTGAVADVTSAQGTIDAIDNAIDNVGAERSKHGAMQNTFNSMIDGLESTNMNLIDSRSKIEDTDFAAEVANLTKNKILQDAGTAVLAQANAQPSMVTSLLRQI